ncbi:MMPL family transporter [Paenibacillus glufosinatiresistens]|uniref:MMPL family transporter n=1 Tax=Paenibacillus glufosinatiresistens TaxID=3070657 RepID=UPI00286DC0BF|nr:MMPL family transporter [Paenibacillus sp. YX.27]
MFARIASVSARWPRTVIALWVLLLAGSLLLAPKLPDHLTSEGFSIPGSESAQASERIRTGFDGFYGQTLTVVLDHPGSAAGDTQFTEKLQAAEKALRDEPIIARLTSPASKGGESLADKKNGRVFIQIDMDATEKEARAFIPVVRDKLRSAGLDRDGFRFDITGSPALTEEMNEVSLSNVEMVERIGLPIVFVLLLLVFGSVVAALLPLLMGMFTIVLTLAVIYLFTLYMPLSSTLTNVVTMLGLGVAIDYALFITQRFREELAKGSSSASAAILSLSTAGRSVFFAGLTVMASLSSLFLPNTMFFRSIALGGLVVVFVSILTAFTLLPALLTLLGSRVDRLRIPFAFKSRSGSGFWTRFISVLLKRPALFLTIGVLFFAALAWPISKLEMHIPVAAFQELPKDSEARLGMEALTEHYGLGESFPVKLLLNTNGGSATGAEALKTVDRLTRQFGDKDGVQQVVSLTSVYPASPEQLAAAYQAPERLPAEARAQLHSLLSRDGRETLLYLIPKEGPTSEKTRALVREIRAELPSALPGGYSGQVTGETATGMDFDKQVTGSLPQIVLYILILSFVLLALAFRSLLLPLKAILLNGLVTASTLGALVILYQWGHLPGSTAQALNVGTPVLICAILFGLSIDYEVIIVSRIKEAYSRGQDNRSAIVEGFTATTGMINGAASIMVVVFGVFLFAGFRFVQELGVGLAIAILMDAVIVRTVLVPASMQLLGRLNWWTPWNHRTLFPKEKKPEGKKSPKAV